MLYLTENGHGYAWVTQEGNITDETGETDSDIRYGKDVKKGDIIDMFVDFDAFFISC